MAELKPCPFCGGKVDHYHTEHISFHECKHRFRCNKCNGIFFFYTKNNYKSAKQTEKEAIKIWNTRAKESERE